MVSRSLVPVERQLNEEYQTPVAYVLGILISERPHHVVLKLPVFHEYSESPDDESRLRRLCERQCRLVTVKTWSDRSRRPHVLNTALLFQGPRGLVVKVRTEKSLEVVELRWNFCPLIVQIAFSDPILHFPQPDELSEEGQHWLSYKSVSRFCGARHRCLWG